MHWPIDPNDVREIAAALKEWLDYELQNGNQVVQTWRGWPERNSICVMLRQPFATATRQAPNVRYELLADPHYWGEELFDPSSGCLLCVEWSEAFRTR